MKFDLEGHEFIALNALLKMVQIAESGGQANLFITEGEVLVNGEVETAKRKKIRSGDTVEIFGELIEVA